MQTHLKSVIRGFEPSVFGIYHPFLFFDMKQSRYAKIWMVCLRKDAIYLDP
jgi:hypothetical protein